LAVIDLLLLAVNVKVALVADVSPLQFNPDFAVEIYYKKKMLQIQAFA
jgi:hypothetical protein